MKQGHLFIAFKSLGDAKGFHFFGTNAKDSIMGILGDSIKLESLKNLKGISPLPGQFKLIHNGKTVSTSAEKDYEFNFSNKIDASQKAANNGIATLGNDGKIPSVQIPAISFQSASVVNSEAAMLSLSNLVIGSIAIRTDSNKNFVLSATPSSTLSNWVELATPNSITSVNSLYGPNVTLTSDDITEGSTNKYFTTARARSAISATSPLSYNASTGTISMTTASASNNGYLTATDFTTFNNKQNTLVAGTDYATPSGNITGKTIDDDLKKKKKTDSFGWKIFKLKQILMLRPLKPPPKLKYKKTKP